MQTLRAVIDVRGQRVNADRPALPARGDADPDRVGRARPHDPDRARPRRARGRAATAASSTLPGAAHFPHLEDPGRPGRRCSRSSSSRPSRRSLDEERWGALLRGAPPRGRARPNARSHLRLGREEGSAPTSHEGIARRRFVSWGPMCPQRHFAAARSDAGQRPRTSPPHPAAVDVRRRTGARREQLPPGDRGDVGRDGVDLRVRQLVAERGHAAPAAADERLDGRRVGLRVVQVRARRARGARVGERMAAAAARRGEHLLAVGGASARGGLGGGGFFGADSSGPMSSTATANAATSHVTGRRARGRSRQRIRAREPFSVMNHSPLVIHDATSSVNTEPPANGSDTPGQRVRADDHHLGGERAVEGSRAAEWARTRVVVAGTRAGRGSGRRRAG